MLTKIDNFRAHARLLGKTRQVEFERGDGSGTLTISDLRPREAMAALQALAIEPAVAAAAPGVTGAVVDGMDEDAPPPHRSEFEMLETEVCDLRADRLEILRICDSDEETIGTLPGIVRYAIARAVAAGSKPAEKEPARRRGMKIVAEFKPETAAEPPAEPDAPVDTEQVMAKIVDLIHVIAEAPFEAEPAGETESVAVAPVTVETLEPIESIDKPFTVGELNGSAGVRAAEQGVEVPEELRSAARLKDAAQILYDMGFKSVDTMIAQCERLKPQVQVFARAVGLADRVGRYIEEFEAAAA